MKRVLQLIFPLLAVLVPFCAAQAQNLTRVEQILALPAEDAGKNPLPVRLSGIVVDVSTASKSFSLHDGSHSVGVSFPGGTVFPAVGDTVDILGVTRTHTIFGLRFPRVEAQSLLITGHAPLPPAQVLPTHEVNSTRHFDQWVAFEGHVLRWKYRKTDNEIVITLGDATGFTTVSVRTGGIEDVPTDLLGARLRLTGVNFSTNTHGPFGSMMIPSVQQVEILSTTGDDPFDQPVTRMEDIATGKAKPGTRLKVRGVVLACLEKNLVYVRDGRFAQANLLFRPWGNNLPYEEYHDAGPWPELKPGDEVEMVGSLMDATHDPMLIGFDLNFCHVRVVGSQPQPDPLPVSLPEVAAGAHTHDWVQLQARLLSLHQLPVDRTSWRTTMMVEAGGKQLPLTHLAPGHASFDTLRIDDELLITALVDDATATDPRQLWLLSAGDVKSLGVSPVVRTRQLWLWGGTASAVLALLAGWIALLRRSNRLQIHAATLLEQKVTERTSELQKTQIELQRALEQERELGELKSRFVTMVSHEFRTPLGIIMSAVELLQHYSDRLPEDEKARQLAEIQSSTKHMGGLMEQVLLLGRAEAGKLTCKPRPLDIVAFAERIIDETQSISDRKCPITLETGGDLSGTSVDEALLRHILTNLIANAVKYSPAGAEVQLRLRRESHEVVFMVIDRGIGIPEKDRGRLFEAFHRCSNVGDTPGTGLGLVIVRRCVDLHGGSLAIASEIGKGTTFTVRLPLFTN